MGDTENRSTTVRGSAADRSSARRSRRRATRSIGHGDLGRAAGHPWSVPELAEISGLSRAAFARTFRDALGQTPMQYLTD
ncbi:AraC family transcriptional regulator [Actinacidiphila oryziradicis]|uniref:AraC family transcriptional regulator n=1 Tax=Actinacidiphila oryziradicis TaxID=2571141 RepID=UPI00389967B3